MAKKPTQSNRYYWLNRHEERMEELFANAVTHLGGIKLRLGEIVKAMAPGGIDQAMLDKMDAALTANNQSIVDAQKEKIVPLGTEQEVK